MIEADSCPLQMESALHCAFDHPYGLRIDSVVFVPDCGLRLEIPNRLKAIQADACYAIHGVPVICVFCPRERGKSSGHRTHHDGHVSESILLSTIHRRSGRCSSCCIHIEDRAYGCFPFFDFCDLILIFALRCVRSDRQKWMDGRYFPNFFSWTTRQISGHFATGQIMVTSDLFDLCHSCLNTSASWKACGVCDTKKRAWIIRLCLFFSFPWQWKRERDERGY
ncbi:hypothetical protein VTL71DRAFT_14862 [Oculimacula yallundae]|uniref:Uncharacterized protein n=1 Tax=Oculimacula yallundae TaxID=86028 RepID=A0ABR4CF02_9HELO